MKTAVHVHTKKVVCTYEYAYMHSAVRRAHGKGRTNIPIYVLYFWITCTENLKAPVLLHQPAKILRSEPAVRSMCFKSNPNHGCFHAAFC